VRKKTIILNSILGVAVLGAGVGGWTVLKGDGNSAAVTRTASIVQLGTVQTSVTGSGNLLPLTQADVNFDSGVTTNKVIEVDVNLGDKVTAGQVLGKIDDKTLQTALTAAKASLASAQANYDKAKAGLATADLDALDASEATSQQAIVNAQAALDNANANAAQDVVTSAESVRQAQLAYDNGKVSTDRDNATAQASYDAALAAQITSQASVDKLTRAQRDCSASPAPTTSSDGTTCASVPAAMAAAQADITTKSNNLATQTTNLPGVLLKSKQTIDSANNALVNAKNNQAGTVLKDQQAGASAQRALDASNVSYGNLLAQDALKRKPPTAADIASQQVALLNAQTAVDTATKNVANAVLVAPAAGTVTTLNGKVGSNPPSTSTSSNANAANATTSTASTAFVQLSDVSRYDVKVGFSEADAAKVKAGQTATVAVSAASNAELPATVRSIDSISTVVSNVVTYYAYLSITQIPATVTLQPGLTATVSVVVTKADNALYLPTSAVTSRGTTGMVKVAADKSNLKKTEDRQITIGLRGDTTLQVLTGLKAGEIVVTERTAVSTVAATNTSGGTLTGTGASGGAGALGGGAGAGGLTGGARTGAAPR
jgi:macrolide-specific efflux system membrane fusion protein